MQHLITPTVQTPLLTVVRAIIKEAEKQHPGTELLFRQGRLHLVIEHEPQERLVIETHKPFPRYGNEKYHISVGHYYEQNGDQLPDPEIRMTSDGFPILMRQSGLGQPEIYAMRHDGGKTLVNTYNKGEIMSLARIWARNLREQGFIRYSRTEAQVKEVQP